MLIVNFLYGFARLAVLTFMGGVVALVLLRSAVGWLKLNPFGWFAFNIRRYSETLLYPLRRSAMVANARQDIAPVVLILLSILLGAFTLQLLSEIRAAAEGIAFGASAFMAGEPARGLRFVVGHLLLAAISVLIICIILQVLFSWLSLYGNRLSRWIFRITEPVLEPLRRTIPAMGMFDLTPLIAYFLLSMLRWAVQVTILG
ncbi:MAG: YggT family protein [Acidobacteria bacterium]|nr:YggT family protein [Acidobacteriota bacterium]